MAGTWGTVSAFKQMQLFKEGRALAGRGLVYGPPQRPFWPSDGILAAVLAATVPSLFVTPPERLL